MDKEKKKETQFEEDIARLLDGAAAETDEATDDDYRSNIDLAKKMIECRGEGPSPAFQEGLKRRLLSKLAEKEIGEARKRARATSFWDWLKNLVPQSPTWRTAAVTIAIAAVALVLVWQIGLFPPKEGPIVTGPLTPIVSVETRASTSETVYALGEDIDIQLIFKNIANEALMFAFPPEIRIGYAETEIARVFNGGHGTLALSPGQSEEYGLIWDQRDNSGQQVPPGDYQLIMPNVQLGEDKGVVSLVNSPVLTVSESPSLVTTMR